MSSALQLALRLGHERVIVMSDRRVGLRAAVAIHDTTLGPGIGGTRMKAYPSFDAAVADALALSRAMTYKAAFAGMPFGGAKAVIDADPAHEKTPELLAAYGRAVAELEGRFVSGGDLGFGESDVRFLAGITRVFDHPVAGPGPDANDLTALGVAAAIGAVADRLGESLPGLHVAIQGCGAVGGRLARRLAEAGARLTVTDLEPLHARALASEVGAEVVAPEEIFAVACDVFSPNAAGGVLDDFTGGRLRARAVCGAANLPFTTPEVADALSERGVVVAPDFVVSAGGILSVLLERGELDEAGVVARVERIGADLAELLDAAAREGTTAIRLAERRVDERLAAARTARG
ncbi:MAG: valine dehydrogenase [Acidobacteriota bacterium]